MLLDRLLKTEPFRNIFFTSILPILTICDLIRLMRVSRMIRRLIQEYLDHHIECIDLSDVRKSSFSWKNFWILFRNNHSTVIELNLTNCTWINDDALASAFLRRQSRLRTLRLSSGFHITDRCLRSVAANCPRLEQLSLNECWWLTGDSLIAVTAGCPFLSIIDLNGCWTLTDDSVIRLVRQCAGNLRSLRLSRIYPLTDDTCRAILSYATRLIYLDISFCSKITDIGIQILCQHPELRKIDATGCESITPIGWQSMFESNLVPLS